MKKRITQLTVICVIIFAACSKGKINPAVIAEGQTNKETTGIVVKNGRLKFASVNELRKLIEMDVEQQSKMLKDLQSLPGFTSKQEHVGNQIGRKTTSECDCEIDNPIISAMVDEHNMLDIGDWTVKLDACDTDKMTYAFYNPLYTTSEIATRSEALMDCDYNPGLGFFEFTIEHDVLDELEISEDSINGDHEAGERRCKDVACSDRSSTVWSQTGWFDGITLNDNGLTQQPVTPVLRLKYDKDFLQFARIYATMDLSGRFPTGLSAYRFEFAATTFYERCRNMLTRNAGFETGQPNNNNEQEFEVYFASKRLAAGLGSVKVRARFNNPNMIFYSNWAEILF